MSSGY